MYCLLGYETKNFQLLQHYQASVFSRRFRRECTTLTVASFCFFFRQFNAIGPLFCSFVQLLRQLIFRLSEAGERGFESRTKPQVF